MYKRDLEIGNPKKFQRHVNDIASSVLDKKGYYLNTYYSKFPHLTSNGIVNIADFHGVSCFTKHNADFNKISRILGAFFIMSSSLLPISILLSLIPNISNVTSGFIFLVLIIIGLILFFYKFGKGICIEIRLVGECYRADIKKETNSIEYIHVRSHVRLIVQGSTLDSTKSLSDSDMKKLGDDGDALTVVLTPFLEKYLEK